PPGAGAARAAPSSGPIRRLCCARAGARMSRCSAGSSLRSSRSRWREMCATCGCAGGARPPRQHDHGTWPARDDGTWPERDDGTWHEHGTADDAPGQEHRHAHAGGQTVTLEQKVLARNDALAGQNRNWLRARGILALNLMSSPGAGKTTLLE